MGTVSIVKTTEGIDSALQRALAYIGGLQAHIRHQDAVMLKPNINGTDGITDIRLVESLIRSVLDFGVRKLFIAEATFGNEHMTDMFFEKSGYADLARRYAVPLINLNRSEIVEVPVEKPHILEKLKIARDVFEADKIINIPVMKVHYAAGITLALKNLKGLLVLDEKRHFHEAGLDKAIVDLNNTIKPALNIIDCIRCMERMGPRGGDMVDLNLLLAGADSAETDYVGCRIMEHTLEEVKHLQLYIEDHKIDLSRIEVRGEKIAEVKYPFKKARMANVIPEGFVIHDIDACSSCMNALLLSFEVLGKNAPRKMHIYLGKQIDPRSLNDEYRIAFGHCCDKSITFDKTIKGCPPFPFDLQKALSE